jgi:hypothetical protein
MEVYAVLIILKCPEIKLWGKVCIKNEWESFGNEILMTKIENNGHKE